MDIRVIILLLVSMVTYIHNSQAQLLSRPRDACEADSEDSQAVVFFGDQGHMVSYSPCSTYCDTNNETLSWFQVFQQHGRSSESRPLVLANCQIWQSFPRFIRDESIPADDNDTVICSQDVDTSTPSPPDGSEWEHELDVIYDQVATDCSDVAMILLAEVITDIFSRHNICSFLVIHTEFYATLFDHVRDLAVHCGLLTYYVSDVSDINDLETGRWFSGIDGVLMIMEHWQYETFQQFRSRLMNDVASIELVVVVDPNIARWEKWLVFGEEVLLIDPHIHTNSCIVLSVTDLVLYLDLWYFSPESESLQPAGTYDRHTGLSFARDNLWEFQKFTNKFFNITSLDLPIFHYIEVNKEGQKEWRGIAIDILKTLATVFNFTYTIVEPPDRKWGNIIQVNGSDWWTGMVGLVQRGEVDFAAGKFTVTMIRDTVIDYTVPYWYESAVMVMQMPIENKLFKFIGPFGNPVWYSIVAATPLYGLIYGLFTYLDSRALKKEGDVGTLLCHWQRSLWAIFGCVVQQGASWVPTSHSLRILFAMWWILAFILGATFTGNLIAVLTAPTLPTPIQTLQELADQSLYSYGVMDGSALNGLFELAVDGVYARLWSQEIFHDYNRVSSHAEGIDKSKTENYVYLGEKSGVAPLIFEDCGFVMGREEFFPSAMAFVFPENSPYLPYFNKKMQKLFEGGIIEYWKQIHYPIDFCPFQAQGSSSALLEDVQGVFLLLGVGILTAFVVLIMEFGRKHHSDLTRTPRSHPESMHSANGYPANGTHHIK